MRFHHENRLRGGRFRKRRAVSDIVAVLLMVAVVVGLGVLVFTFASTGLSSLTGSFTGLMSNQGSALAEHSVVEQVAFCLTASCLASCSPSCVLGADVYVRNVGTIASTLVSVYVADQSLNTFTTQVAISTALNVGAVVDISHSTVSFTPIHGHTYSFTVTSFLGNSVIFDAKAS